MIGGEESTIDFTVTNEGGEPASGVTVTFEVEEPGRFVMARSARGSCEQATCRLGSFDGFESVTGHVVVVAELGIKTRATVHADTFWILKSFERRHSSVQTETQLAENQPGALIWATPANAVSMSCGDSVVVDREAAYSGFGSKLYAVSKSSGETLWLHDHESSMFQPVLADGNIYVLSRDEGYYIRSLDSLTGTLNWQQEVVGQVNSPVEVYGGSVYLTGNDWVVDGRSEYGYLISLDASTGVVQWQYRVDNWVNTTPVVFDGNVFFGTYGGGDDYLYSIEPTSGELRRQYKITGGVYDTPLIADGNAYIVTGYSSLHSIDLETETENWVYRPEGRAYDTPILSDGNLYLRIYDEEAEDYLSLHALDAATGSVIWQYTPGVAMMLLSAYEGNIYVPTYTKLVSLDGLTGSQEWEAGYGWICGPLTAADGVLYGRTVNNDRYLIFAIRTR